MKRDFLWTEFGGRLFDGTVPPDFSMFWGSAGATQQLEVTDARNNHGDSVVSVTATPYQYFQWDRAGSYDNDVDVLALFQVPGGVGSNWNFGLFLNAVNDGGEDVYSLFYGFGTPDDDLRINRYDNGAGTTLDTVSSATSIVTATWYWLHFRKEGNNLMGRAWEYGTAAPNWEVEVTDATYSGGTVGFISGDDVTEIDYFAVAWGGEYAPMPEPPNTPLINTDNVITAYPANVRSDATSFLVYTGEPNRKVDWSLTGDGTLTVLTDYTNENGVAWAKYTPGTIGTNPVIDVVVGA